MCNSNNRLAANTGASSPRRIEPLAMHKAWAVQVKAACAFDLHRKITLVKPLDGGQENLTYLVADSDGRSYVCRISRVDRSSSQLGAELVFLEFLGRSMAVVVPPVGGLVWPRTMTLKQEQRRYTIFPFVSGRPIPLTHLTNSVLTQLGHNLGRIVSLGAQLPARLNRPELYNDKRFRYATRGSWALSSGVGQLFRAFPVPEGDRMLCHGDPDDGNVLVTGSKLSAILDFDDCAYAPLGWDTAVIAARFLQDASVTLNTSVARLRLVIAAYEHTASKKLNYSELATMIAHVLLENIASQHRSDDMSLDTRAHLALFHTNATRTGLLVAELERPSRSAIDRPE